MGLLFALQPDLRRSSNETLVVRSSKRRFSLGMGFLFGGLLLATMYQAASPIFRVFWEEGGAFDKALAGLIVGVMILYPLIALGCWFFEEAFVVRRRADGRFDVESWLQVLGLRWRHRRADGLVLADLSVGNWKGAVNMASIEAAESGRADRYATQGHWILSFGPLDLERRAKRDDVELLRAQVESFISSH